MTNSLLLIRKASRFGLCLPRVLAQRHFGFSRTEKEYGRWPPPHSRYEHGQLDTWSIYEADGSEENWTLFRANEVPDLHELYGKAFEDRYQEYEAKADRGEIFAESMPAIDLWGHASHDFETGHPWITFKDPCNLRSPQDHCGVIHSSNLCTEITLNTSADETAVCNLGSIVLDSHLDKDGNLDHEKLRDHSNCSSCLGQCHRY